MGGQKQPAPEDGPDRPRPGDELVGQAYARLRQIAAVFARRRGAFGGHQATSLVHEAYLRLLPQLDGIRDERELMRLATVVIRHVLVDHARRRKAQRRGGDGFVQVNLDEGMLVGERRTVDLLDLDEALDRFADRYPVEAKVVELRFFSGLENKEVAEVLRISPAGASSHWSFARAWLQRELGRDGRAETGKRKKS